jgi:alcohol dehydrogenase class IV
MPTYFPTMPNGEGEPLGRLAPFEFATAGRIIFGAGALANIGPIAREFGSRALVVVGRDPSRAARLRELLLASGVATEPFSVGHEPTIEDVQRGVETARRLHCEFVIGFGGGSAIDAAKAIAALLTNTEPITEYLEVIGRGRPLAEIPAPCLAIPTTAGTGAEVTRNAVLASGEHRVKVSLRHSLMLPRVALVDPTLTYDLPPALTATTGLDAFTQLLEPYVSSRANPMTDSLCVEGLRRVARSLRIAVENGRSAAARDDMALASLFGGLALANAGLGAVHGLAGPIGGAFSAPHGAVCAALLPHATAINLSALHQRSAQSASLARYADIARIVTGRPAAGVDDLAPYLQSLVTALGIPPLSAYGVMSADIPALVSAAAKASSMKANSIVLSSDELTAILERAL